VLPHRRHDFGQREPEAVVEADERHRDEPRLRAEERDEVRDPPTGDVEAAIRPGGLAQDFPEGFAEDVLAVVKQIQGQLPGYDKLLTEQPIWRQRLEKVGYLPLDGCLALGATGPILRAAGLPWDLRKIEPYCGYETYDFNAVVPPFDDRWSWQAPRGTVIGDAWHRFMVRMLEVVESIRICEQALDRYPSAQGSHRIEQPLDREVLEVRTDDPRLQL